MGFRMTSITKSYQILRAYITFIIVDVMYAHSPLLLGFAAKLASVVVSLSDTLLEAWGKALISGVDKLAVHRKLLSTLGRTKAFSFCLCGNVALAAIFTDAFYIITLGNSPTAKRAILFVPRRFCPKSLTASGTGLRVHPRMGRTLIRAISLVIRRINHKLFTAMLTSSNALSRFAHIGTPTRTKPAKAALKVKAVCLKFSAAYLAGIKNRRLALGLTKTGIGTKYSVFRNGFTANWTHGNSPYSSYWPYMMSWGAGYREASCQVSS